MHIGSEGTLRNRWRDVLAIYVDGLWKMLVYATTTIAIVALCSVMSFLVSLTLVADVFPIIYVVIISVVAYRQLRDIVASWGGLSQFSWSKLGQALAMQNVMMIVIIAVSVVYLAQVIIGSAFKSVGL